MYAGVACVEKTREGVGGGSVVGGGMSYVRCVVWGMWVVCAWVCERACVNKRHREKGDNEDGDSHTAAGVWVGG